MGIVTARKSRGAPLLVKRDARPYGSTSLPTLRWVTLHVRTARGRVTAPGRTSVRIRVARDMRGMIFVAWRVSEPTAQVATVPDVQLPTLLKTARASAYSRKVQQRPP
jgi:hypothetical protein